LWKKGTLKGIHRGGVRCQAGGFKKNGSAQKVGEKDSKKQKKASVEGEKGTLPVLKLANTGVTEQ